MVGFDEKSIPPISAIVGYTDLCSESRTAMEEEFRAFQSVGVKGIRQILNWDETEATERLIPFVLLLIFVESHLECGLALMGECIATTPRTLRCFNNSGTFSEIQHGFRLSVDSMSLACRLIFNAIPSK
jgi:hypothetical protein